MDIIDANVEITPDHKAGRGVRSCTVRIASGGPSGRLSGDNRYTIGNGKESYIEKHTNKTSKQDGFLQ